MGTVRAEARVVIGAKMESYDARGNIIESKPASSSQAKSVKFEPADKETLVIAVHSER